MRFGENKSFRPLCGQGGSGRGPTRELTPGYSRVFNQNLKRSSQLPRPPPVTHQTCPAPRLRVDVISPQAAAGVTHAQRVSRHSFAVSRRPPQVQQDPIAANKPLLFHLRENNQPTSVSNNNQPTSTPPEPTPVSNPPTNSNNRAIPPTNSPRSPGPCRCLRRRAASRSGGRRTAEPRRRGRPRCSPHRAPGSRSRSTAARPRPRRRRRRSPPCARTALSGSYPEDFTLFGLFGGGGGGVIVTRYGWDGEAVSPRELT